ncbi:MAG: 50S ribosomal protein L29 [candidate division WOR-3 bacterium]|nr:MAG: 50S ribosomal protein L29 [candidate division WOR-3 bacterium]
MKVFELREKTREELKDMLNGLHRELFNLHLRRGAQELPNPLRLRTLRREIARIKTILREDEMGLKTLLQPSKVAPKTKKGDKGA